MNIKYNNNKKYYINIIKYNKQQFGGADISFEYKGNNYNCTEIFDLSQINKNDYDFYLFNTRTPKLQSIQLNDDSSNKKIYICQPIITTSTIAQQSIAQQSTAQQQIAQQSIQQQSTAQQSTAQQSIAQQSIQLMESYKSNLVQIKKNLDNTNIKIKKVQNNILKNDMNLPILENNFKIDMHKYNWIIAGASLSDVVLIKERIADKNDPIHTDPSEMQRLLAYVKRREDEKVAAEKQKIEAEKKYNEQHNKIKEELKKDQEEYDELIKEYEKQNILFNEYKKKKIL